MLTESSTTVLLAPFAGAEAKQILNTPESFAPANGAWKGGAAGYKDFTPPAWNPSSTSANDIRRVGVFIKELLRHYTTAPLLLPRITD